MADDVGETCCTELCLGLGSNTKSSRRDDSGGSVKLDNNKQQNNNKKLSFILSLESPFTSRHAEKLQGKAMLSSTVDDHLMATDRDNHSVDSNSDSDNSSHRKKKLRLTKEQSTLLEDSFKLQTTLIPFQKQSLADKLNLKPRQVQVWFQNRRARNQLKQTEEDCELLKRCCETLTNENQRLKKQLHDLKSSYKLNPFPFDIQSLEPSPSANSVTCSFCKKNIGPGESKNVV